MKLCGLTAVLAALLALACAAYGYPTLQGPTGIVIVPTADTAGFANLQLAAAFYDSGEAGLVENSYPVRALFGPLPGLEIGAAYWIAGFFGNDVNTWNLNAKLRSPIGLFGFATAVGAVYGQTNVPIGNDITITQVYLVGTNNLTGILIPGSLGALRLTLGANWTQFENGDSEDALRAFAGVDVQLLRRLSVAAEYQTASSSLGDVDPLTSLVARLTVSRNLTLEGGVTNADPLTGGFTTLDEQNLFFGLIYQR